MFHSFNISYYVQIYTKLSLGDDEFTLLDMESFLVTFDERTYSFLTGYLIFQKIENCGYLQEADLFDF
jgi:hypothetical protein